MIDRTDNKQRIEYIDTLRGLCMLSIVWYHTDHPGFLEYPFYNSALFFVSGMLYKPSSGGMFLKKKFFSFLIPFVFFYLIYYLFLLSLNFVKYHSVSNDILFSIFDVSDVGRSQIRIILDIVLQHCDSRCVCIWKKACKY